MTFAYLIFLRWFELKGYATPCHFPVWLCGSPFMSVPACLPRASVLQEVQLKRNAHVVAAGVQHLLRNVVLARPGSTCGVDPWQHRQPVYSTSTLQDHVGR